LLHQQLQHVGCRKQNMVALIDGNVPEGAKRIFFTRLVNNF
jgi:hypothetical protein